MRRTLLGAMVILATLALGRSTHAQTAVTPSSGFSDPFFLYYSWFLPRQQYLATQAGPELSINARSAARQESAVVDRQALYERIPSLGESDLYADPLRPFTRQAGPTRMVRTTPTGIVSQNLNGTGPPAYFNRAGGYYPTLRTGRSAGRAMPAVRGGSRFNSAAAGMMGYGGVPGVR